jgi:subfamily B ATP-binding cassette protein HlyB/CyaB
MAEKFAHSVVQCLAAIAQHQGIRINPERLIHDFALADEEPKAALVLRMAADIGMKAKADNLSWQQLVAQQGVFPLLARLKTGAGVIVVGVKKEGDAEQVAIVDPLADAASVTLHTEATFCEVWGGDVILLKRAHSLFDAQQPFGLRWFIPEILKQRTAFRDVIIAGMSMNVLALAAPLFFQLVIDKVLVHQSSSTLAVLTIGVTVALLFDSAFGYLRQMLLLAATNKIDMHVTRRTFGHLLSLSIDFFELSTAGVITRQMQQLEGIRQFLTGRLLFAGLDAFALVIFLPLLFTYSVTLALIVLAFTLAIAAIIAILLPTFRQRLDRLNLAEGARQALLVEAIHGMRTIKSLAIEPVQRKAWDQMSAEAINAHFQVGKLAISGNSLTDFLGKLMPVVIIFIGAQSVFDGKP